MPDLPGGGTRRRADGAARGAPGAPAGPNVIAELRGRPLTPYEHANAGSVASLGLYKGVAEIYGVKLRGFPAWFMHRTYHVSRVPTLNRKVRVLADWTLALFFPRDIVSLGAFQDPQADFRAAAAPARRPARRVPARRGRPRP